jgi:hypothetical protein
MSYMQPIPYPENPNVPALHAHEIAYVRTNGGQRLVLPGETEVGVIAWHGGPVIERARLRAVAAGELGVVQLGARAFEIEKL